MTLIIFMISLFFLTKMFMFREYSFEWNHINFFGLYSKNSNRINYVLASCAIFRRDQVVYESTGSLPCWRPILKHVSV